MHDSLTSRYTELGYMEEPKTEKRSNPIVFNNVIEQPRKEEGIITRILNAIRELTTGSPPSNVVAEKNEIVTIDGCLMSRKILRKIVSSDSRIANLFKTYTTTSCSFYSFFKFEVIKQAYPSLNDDVDATLRLPFAQFTPASWESDEHKTMTLTPDLLTNVTAFSLYLNDGDTEFTDAWSGGDRPRSGQITIDSIRCVDTTAETARDEARAQLAETIAEAVRLTKDDYTTDSWEAFADALTQADAVLADADATLDELTAARTALVDTTNGLVKKPGDSGTGDIDPGTKPDTAPQVNGKEPAGTTASTGSATLVIAAAALALMLAGAGVLAIRRHRS